MMTFNSNAGGVFVDGECVEQAKRLPLALQNLPVCALLR